MTNDSDQNEDNQSLWQKFVNGLKYGLKDYNKLIDYEITDEDIEDFRENKLDQIGGFDEIGFARPLGGYFYQFFFAILGGVVLFALFGAILEVLYPYPTAKGYVTTSMALFGFIQFIFNIPTGFAIERFVSEWRIKKPSKMLEYIRFYIWYQMMTGIVLVTSLSIFIFEGISSGSNLEYAKWIMLIMLTREYPAMLNLFMQCIKGLQAFDKESQIYFFKDVITKGLEIVFVIAGRLWGEATPQIGGIMGIAIGYAIGTYIDDFINMGVAAAFFNRALKNMGFSLKDAVVPRISWDTAKTSMWYGFQVSWPGIFSSITGFFVFFAWYDAVPAYSTLIVLNSTADELANITKRSEGINVKGSLSESYNNNRRELTSYYISNIFKWHGFFTTGIGVVVITFFPALLGLIFSENDIELYLLAIPFILPNIIHTVTCEGLDGTANQILNMCNYQWFASLVAIGHNITSLITTYIWLYVLFLPQRFGIMAMIWLLPMGNFPSNFGWMLVKWFYINKNVVKVRIPWWQAFIAPLGPAILVFITGTLWINTAHAAMISAGLGLIGGIVTVLFAFIVCFLFLFISMYSWFGGWDDYNLKVFKRAVEISGPSKIFFVPIAKFTDLLKKVSPFHNKHPIPWEKADKQAIELMIIRERNDQQRKKMEQGTI